MPTRVEGYDLARAGAIVGMVLINFQVYLVEPPSGAASAVPWRWLAHLPSGRSSALFVTLAGAGIALMARRASEPRAVVKTLLLRALFLLVAGNLLKLVWPIDILHFYAFYLAIAAALFRLPGRLLLSLAALLALVAGALRFFWPQLWELDLEYFSAGGMALDVFVDGVHPVVPWVAFALVGVWLGRHDIRDRRVCDRLMLGGAVVAVGAELASLVLGAAAVRWLPAEVADVVRVSGTRWSPDPLYVLGASGSSVFFITLAQRLAARWRSRSWLRALLATGQLAFSIYVFHALVGVGIPKWLLGLEDAMSLWAVTLYWLAFTVVAVLLAALLKRRFRVGPLEWLLRRVAPAPPGKAPAAPVSGSASSRPLAWVLIGLGLFFVVGARFVGVARPSLGCPEPPTLPERGTYAGEVTLTCPHRDMRLSVLEPAELTLETRSGQDLYLELHRDGEELASDDDSGIGLDARLVHRLEPGTYRVRVRPYAAAAGAFRLQIDQRRLDGSEAELAP